MNSEGVSNHCSAQAKAYSFQLSFAQESWPRSWSRWPEGLADSVYLLWLVMTVHYVNVEIICRNQEKLWGMKMMLKRAIMQRRSKHILSLLWMRLALVFNFEWIPNVSSSMDSQLNNVSSSILDDQEAQCAHRVSESIAKGLQLTIHW